MSGKPTGNVHRTAANAREAVEVSVLAGDTVDDVVKTFEAEVAETSQSLTARKSIGVF